MLDKIVACWKPQSLYHGLASELLLHDKEEFRIFWRMNTDKYEVSKFVLIGGAQLGEGEGETSPILNLVEKFVP